jgi:hypothetical protein
MPQAISSDLLLIAALVASLSCYSAPQSTREDLQQSELNAALRATSPSGQSKAAVAGIDRNNRAAVTALFNQHFNAAEPAIEFTGNVNSCVAGTTSNAFKDAIVTRLNFFRVMVGLPGNVTLSTAASAEAQAAALIMSANNTLTHTPDASLRCFTQAGLVGANTSNLFLGVSGTQSIDGFLSDFGVGNEFVGHRRWLLFPLLTQIGTGDIRAPGVTEANAIAVFGGNLHGGTRTKDFVAFPGDGHWPHAMLPDSNRWSLGVAGADFSSATVTVAVNGQVVNTPVIARDSRAFGDPAIVFTPATGLSSTNAPANDVAVSVAVNGVRVGGQTRNIAYTVTVFDPAKAGPACVTSTDSDSDGVSDCLEQQRGTNPNVRDNNIFAIDTAGHQRFVEQQFRDFVFREADTAGRDFWAGQLNAGTTSRASFIEQLLRGVEYDGLVAPMTRLYQGTYLRVPDYGGLQFWLGQYRASPNRTKLVEIGQAFATAPEFVARYGNIDNSTYIRRLYQNILQREPDAAGLAFWIAQLSVGVSRGEMLVNFTDSAEYVARVAAETTLINVASGMLKREPTAVEMAEIVPILRASGSVTSAATQQLLNAVLQGSEYRRRFVVM